MALIWKYAKLQAFYSGNSGRSGYTWDEGHVFDPVDCDEKVSIPALMNKVGSLGWELVTAEFGECLDTFYFKKLANEG